MVRPLCRGQEQAYRQEAVVISRASETFRQMARESGPRLAPEELEDVEGSYRFDIDDESWMLTLRDGYLLVTEESGAADCVVRASDEEFQRLMQGNQNMLTAFLQGRIDIEGDMAMAHRLHTYLRVETRAPR
jgi:putative sterol carrier protein